MSFRVVQVIDTRWESKAGMNVANHLAALALYKCSFQLSSVSVSLIKATRIAKYVRPW